MEDNFYYLSYYQVMIFSYVIEQFKKNNKNFKDEISEAFLEYILNRTFEIAMHSPIKLKMKATAKNYRVSKSMVEYLIRLTGVNVLDKGALKQYIELVKEYECNLEEEALSKLNRNLRLDRRV